LHARPVASLARLHRQNRSTISVKKKWSVNQNNQNKPSDQSNFVQVAFFSHVEQSAVRSNTGGSLTGFFVCKSQILFQSTNQSNEKDPNMSAVIESLNQRLTRIEEMLAQLIDARVKKEYYSTFEVARLLDRAEFTVREWARNGRIWAEKRQFGRGNTKEWMISHVELERIQNEGLLPK
jgi:hypothetical protein